MPRGFRASGAVVVAAAVAAGLAVAADPVVPPIPPPRAESAKVDAPAAVSPGSRVAVTPEGRHAPGATFRWTQVEGPTVAIDDPAAEKIRFEVPSGADHVAFLVTISEPSNLKTVRVSVPIASAPTAPADPPALPAPGGDEEATADAGEDAAGEVGRTVKLDGSRSRAAVGASFRWIAASGPAVEGWRSEGSSAWFVPTAPGLYRFALVVGSADAISPPDFVEVEVSALGSPEATAPEESPLSRSIAAVVAKIPGGRETSSQVADVFAAVAEKAPLYSSYAQLQAELTRRLDVVVPADPSARKAWSETVFLPLSQLTAAELSKGGVEVRPTMADQALSPAQRDRLRDLYLGLADAFRPRPLNP